jgi:imidazolonepropionase-like amidohydrolase
MAVLIRGGLLLDGTGRDPVPDGAVLIEGKRIASAGSERRISAPRNAEVIDAGGALMLPGLFNLHDHISRKSLRRPKPGLSFREQGAKLMAEPVEYLALHSARNAFDELLTGVTTIRDMGLAGYSAVVLKRAIDEGLLVGPRLLPCGKPICITGGHAHQWSREADGPDQVRKAVREQIKAGADCIKFMGSGGLVAFPDEDPDVPEYNLDELQAGVSEAHKFNLRCAVHAYPPTAIKNAVRAGMDSIDHGVYMDEEAIALMLAHGTALVPTMSGLAYLPRQYRSVGLVDLAEEIERRVLGQHKASVEAVWEAGIPIGVGTDTGGEVVEEMELLQEAAGLTEQQCLEAATRVSAQIAGLDGLLGTLEPGKLADVVLMDPAALEVIGRARNVQLVFKEGQPVAGDLL